jgi:hypothetical protein
MKVLPEISKPLIKFIQRQHLFFVASSPLSAEGHINLSPKGLESLCILSPRRVAYLDLVGSGNETSAHLRENGRITIMFCAFEGAPTILRLYGQGRTVLPTHPEWETLAQHFARKDFPGARQIIVVDITRVQTSCGSGVPLFDYQGERDQLIQWAEKKGAEGLRTYIQENNCASLDGLPTELGAQA